MFSTLSLPILIGVFFAGCAAIWLAGVRLSTATGVLSSRFGLGQALGGVVLLAIATNLPEIAIALSAAASGRPDVAGWQHSCGIALQTVVLVFLDAFGMPEHVPLTYKAASLTLVIEGLLVIAVLIISIMGTQMPASVIAVRLTPVAILIAVVWFIGVWLIGKANAGLPWQDQAGDAPDTQERPKGHSQNTKDKRAKEKGISTAHTLMVFVIAAVVTLFGGVVLERCGEAIATKVGMTGVLFGATVLAAATSLPEVSTGLTSTRARDYQLAISDIFGGNAFLPVLFLVATLISGKAVLPKARDTDIYLGCLGILLTSVYLGGLIFRPRRKILGLGVDSLAVLILYVLATAGLFAIAQSGPIAS